MKLNTNLFGINYDFKSVKEVMAKANEQKAATPLQVSAQRMRKNALRQNMFFPT